MIHSEPPPSKTARTHQPACDCAQKPPRLSICWRRVTRSALFNPFDGRGCHRAMVISGQGMFKYRRMSSTSFLFGRNLEERPLANLRPRNAIVTRYVSRCRPPRRNADKLNHSWYQPRKSTWRFLTVRAVISHPRSPRLSSLPLNSSRP
jgi:hypothetical protein